VCASLVVRLRDSAGADCAAHESEQFPLGVRDAHDEPKAFVAVLSGERDGSFAVDQTGDVGRIL